MKTVEEMKEMLMEPKAMAKAADGEVYPVCLAEVETKKLRNATTTLLRILDPKAHAKYRAMKEADPTLKGKREAYGYAFSRLLEIGYNISGL